MSLFQHICPGCLWARDKMWLLSRVQRLAGLAEGTEAFCPSWRHQPGQKRPTRTKGWPFCLGWRHQPGQKAPPRDSSKGSYSILSHVYYLGELPRKPCARQKVLGSNPVVCKKIFNVKHLLSRFCHPEQKLRGFCPGSLVPVPKPGQKPVWNRDKRPNV